MEKCRGFGGLAQLVEHMHHTHGVTGSSPALSTFVKTLGALFYKGFRAFSFLKI